MQSLIVGPTDSLARFYTVEHDIGISYRKTIKVICAFSAEVKQIPAVGGFS